MQAAVNGVSLCNNAGRILPVGQPVAVVVDTVVANLLNAAVAKLRALGDKRAIPALQEAQNRPRTAGLLRRRSNANACLRTDAEEAVRYRESF
jgi:hypothetical protein